MSRSPRRRSPRSRIGTVLALLLAPLAAACGEDLTGPDAVASVQVSPSSASLDALDATQSFTAEARTSSGKMVREISFRWESEAPDVATVDGTGTATAVGNGTARIRVSVVGAEMSATARLTVEQAVASLSVSPDSSELASVGDTTRFDAGAEDANGNAVPPERVSWSSRDTSVAVVDASGETVARGQGATRIVASAGQQRDSAVVVVRSGEGPLRANLVVDTVLVKPRGVLADSSVGVEAELRNRGGTDAGPFRWEVLAGDTAVAGGEVDGLDAGASVRVSAGGVGPFDAGLHPLTVRADAGEAIEESSEGDNTAGARLQSHTRGYEPELQFVGSLSDTTRQLIREARDRWSEVIAGDLPEIVPSDTLDLDRCFGEEVGAGTRTDTIDDVLVMVRSDSIDGPGGTTARAGPCFVRASDSDPRVPPHPVVGAVELDSADVEDAQADGTFVDLVVHEIGHVLGIGGLWNFRGSDGEGPFQLLEGAGTDDPTFVGPLAVETFLEIGGDQVDADPVPVANRGGQGTRDSHWRESVFENELMTGFLNLGRNPLSVVTVASLADQFYAVDFGAADEFQIRAAVTDAGSRRGRPLGDHLLEVPVYGVDPSGRVSLRPLWVPRR